MSQEKVKVVRAAFEAFKKGDMEGVLRLCDENIEITQAASFLGSLHGSTVTQGCWRRSLSARAVGRLSHRHSARRRDG